MPALPFAHTLHSALAHHIFGRCLDTAAAAEPAAQAQASCAAMAPAPSAPQDEWPDLAQRVRDVGEW